MSDFKHGDRVRVTFEAKVHRADSFGLTLANGNAYIPTANGGLDGLTVERVAETFKPGDFVRHKGSGHKYLIVGGGYVSMTDLYFVESAHTVFTSKRYEKYDVAPVPF